MDLKQLLSIIIMLAVIGFIVTAMAGAQDDMRSDVKAKLPSSTIANETLVGVDNITRVAFLHTFGISCVQVYNGTLVEWPLGNFSCNDDGLIISGINDTHIHNTTFVVTYTHKSTTSEYNITGNSLKGMDNASSFFDEIGTFAGIAALLGMLYLLFLGVKNKKE